MKSSAISLLHKNGKSWILFVIVVVFAAFVIVCFSYKLPNNFGFIRFPILLDQSN